ncbi:unnamed protein product [Urochloa humidicola]
MRQRKNAMNLTLTRHILYQSIDSTGEDRASMICAFLPPASGCWLTSSLFSPLQGPASMSGEIQKVLPAGTLRKTLLPPAHAAAPADPWLSPVHVEEFVLEEEEDKDGETPADPCVERVLEGKEATGVRLAAMGVAAGSRCGLEKLAVRPDAREPPSPPWAREPPPLASLRPSPEMSRPRRALVGASEPEEEKEKKRWGPRVGWK